MPLLCSKPATTSHHPSAGEEVLSDPASCSTRMSSPGPYLSDRSSPPFLLRRPQRLLKQGRCLPASAHLHLLFPLTKTHVSQTSMLLITSQPFLNSCLPSADLPHHPPSNYVLTFPPLPQFPSPSFIFHCSPYHNHRGHILYSFSLVSVCS